MKPYRVSCAICILLMAMLALPTAFAEPISYGEAINAFLTDMAKSNILPEIDTLPSLASTSDFEASELAINLTDFLVIYISKDETDALVCQLYIMLADLPDSVDIDSIYQSYLKSFDPSLSEDEVISVLAQLHSSLKPSLDGYALTASVPMPGFELSKTLGQTEAVETLSIRLPQT